MSSPNKPKSFEQLDEIFLDHRSPSTATKVNLEGYSAEFDIPLEIRLALPSPSLMAAILMRVVPQ